MVVEVDGQRPGDPVRRAATDLRIVFHHQAAGHGHGPEACRSRSASSVRWAARSRSRLVPARARYFGCDCRRRAAAGRDAHAGGHPAPRAGQRPPPHPGRRRRGPAAQSLPTDAERPPQSRDGPGRPGGAARCWRRIRDSTPFSAICRCPSMSGMELHAAVRERFPWLAERFIFVTGGAFSAEARRFLDESVTSVINKPFRVEDLLALIERTASGIRQQAPERSERAACRGHRERRAPAQAGGGRADPRRKPRADVAAAGRSAHAAPVGVSRGAKSNRASTRGGAHPRGARGARLRP